MYSQVLGVSVGEVYIVDNKEILGISLLSSLRKVE